MHQHAWGWKPCINEAGWYCLDCGRWAPGDPPGFSPEFDRKLIHHKVRDIMNVLHASGLVYFSNSDDGFACASTVVDYCDEVDAYDQQTITHAVAEYGLKSHQEYWRKIGTGVMDGKDPRDRCQCGALGAVWSFHNGKRSVKCGECQKRGDNASV